MTIQSDSSNKAWGGVYDANKTGGPWAGDELEWHINQKELLAACFTLQCFCKDLKNCHVRLEIDNTTAVAYINNQGGKQEWLHNTAKRIWMWAKDRNLWLSAAHLPGSKNIEADTESRKAYGSEGEWMLDSKIFNEIMLQLGHCYIDLFATRLNAQLSRYISWHPDPGALAVDAFAYSWANELVYAFPPFCVISRVLAKVAAEGAEMV